MLSLAVATVLVVELLIYIPSIVTFRATWLGDKLSAARIAALVLEAAPGDMVPDTLVQELLDGVGALSIAMRFNGARRLLAHGEALPMVARRYDLRDMSELTNLAETFDTLLNGKGRIVSVTGPAPMGAEFVEIVIEETPLHDALLRFSANVLLLTLVVAAAVAGALYLALVAVIVRPVRRLIAAMSAFASSPHGEEPAAAPNRRRDEIGVAEDELAAMRRVLTLELKQRRHLAELGLAVSKISHDLRNMLTSAVLVSDQLSAIPEPRVQRFAPTLIRSLDRAIAFCESALAFGALQDRPPVAAPIDMEALLDEVRDGLPTLEGLQWRGIVAPGLAVQADAQYLFRALLNLCRNAVEALRDRGPASGAPAILVQAGARGRDLVVTVADNGPGVPAAVRERIFQAFSTGGRGGGSGLGLAISHELVHAHGGALRLVDAPIGATFELVLPDAAALAHPAASA